MTAFDRTWFVQFRSSSLFAIVLFIVPVHVSARRSPDFSLAACAACG